MKLQSNDVRIMKRLSLITIAALACASSAFAQEPAVVYPATGIEAPTQPTGKSSSTYTKLERITPKPGRGTQGEVRVRVRDLVAVRGQEQNLVQGIGLVTGLAGTGDSGLAARQALQNLLLTQNITLPIGSLTSKNVAVVWVEVELPAGIKPGRRVDVRVSSLYDSSSLVGGTLVRCELTDMSGTDVYATQAAPSPRGVLR